MKHSPLFFNIHNLTSIAVYGGKNEKNKIKRILSNFLVSEISSTPVITFYPTENAPKPKGDYIIGSERYFFQNKDSNSSILYFEKENTTLKVLRKHEDTFYEIYTKNIDWLYLLLQLNFLKKNCTFLHAGAFSYQGKGILLPAWGGTGKTLAIGNLIKEERVGFLGDDFVIISANGKIYNFPRPLVLYSYHAGTFPKVFRKSLIVKLSLLEKIRSEARKVAKPFPKLRQWGYRILPRGAISVPVERVVPQEKIKNSVPASIVLFLVRYSGSSLKTEPIDPQELSNMALGITHYELSLSNITQLLMVPAIFSLANLEEYFSKPKKIFQSFLEKTKCQKILIPTKTSGDEVSEYLFKIVKSHLANR